MTKSIAIDCMGGDDAPKVIIEGLKMVFADGIGGIHFNLFGDDSLNKYIDLIKEYSDKFSVHSAPEVDLKNMKPSAAIRMARNSSMGLAIQSVKSGESDACISAGNTGAYMALSKVLLRMIPGVERPAIATYIPKDNGRCIMLDLGANADCSPKNLIDFAIMGEAFAKVGLGISDPKVAILNIGAEDIKGNLIVQDAYKQITENALVKNFYGFIEGDQIFKTDVDVVVTDGFSGNIALKVTEGTVRFLMERVKKAFQTNILTKLSYLFLRKALYKNLGFLNPSNHNGAMLLGLNGVVVKSHGGTDAYGFANAIKSTIKIVEDDFIQKLKGQWENQE